MRGATCVVVQSAVFEVSLGWVAQELHTKCESSLFCQVPVYSPEYKMLRVL